MRKVLVALAVMLVGWVPLQIQGSESSEARFAAVQGEVQWVRTTGRATAALGEAVRVGDRVRTDAGQRAKIVALDNAVFDLAPGTEVAVDELGRIPEAERLVLALRLFRGRLLLRTTPAFARGASSCIVETGTATVSVPSGEIVVHYDADGEYTEVAVLSGEAEMTGKVAAVAGGRVRLMAGDAARVSKGRIPQQPAQWGVGRVRQYAEGIEIFGTGRRDGLNVLHPLTLGRLMDPSDIVDAPWVSAVGSRPPGLLLPDQMSADVYTNTQPLEVFHTLPPGRPLTGDVRVDF